jgi:hypothetical protein
LPDGFFPDQKLPFGYILKEPEMDNDVISYCHLDYFTTVGLIVCAFGTIVVICPLWYIVCTKKNLATLVLSFGSKVGELKDEFPLLPTYK